MIKKSKILICLLACLSINSYCHATKAGFQNPDSTSSSPQQLSRINIEDSLVNHEDENSPVRQVFPMLNPSDIVFPDQIPPFAENTERTTVLIPFYGNRKAKYGSGYDAKRVRKAIGNYDYKHSPSKLRLSSVCKSLTKRKGLKDGSCQIARFALLQLRKNHGIQVSRTTLRHSALMFKFFDENPELLSLAIEEIEQLHTRNFKLDSWTLDFTD